MVVAFVGDDGTVGEVVGSHVGSIILVSVLLVLDDLDTVVDTTVDVVTLFSDFDTVEDRNTERLVVDYGC